MSESFWWNLLAGFLIGFVVSTLWEWLYFRRRRMAIRNRRIDELEATVRTYAAASGATQSNAVAADDWNEPQFDNPNVYLETEEPTSAATPGNLSHPIPSSGSYTAAYGASRDSTAMHPNRPTEPPPGAQPTATAQRAAGFQSVAVQQPVATNDGAPVKAAGSAAQASTSTEPPDKAATVAAAPVNQASDKDRSDITKTAAVITAATVAPYFTEEAKQPTAGAGIPTSTPSTQSPAAGVTAINPATASVQQSPAESSDLSKNSASMRPSPAQNGRTAHYANGRVDQTYPEIARQPSENLSPERAAEEIESTTPDLAASTVATDVLAASRTSKPITSNDLDALAASINHLIDTVNKDPTTAQPPLGRTGQLSPQDDDPYTTKITGRTEFMLVRLVQTLVQFFRQVRAVLSGEDAEKPTIYTPGALADNAAVHDDLTMISGLTQAHAERLRVGSITTFAQIASLSTDELRLITFTPGAQPADYARWRAEAGQLAASKAVGEP